MTISWSLPVITWRRNDARDQIPQSTVKSKETGLKLRSTAVLKEIRTIKFNM